MAKQKLLEELSVQQLAERYNFIVPEIQREYVWGNNEFSILDKFFTDIKEAIKETSISEVDKVHISVLEKTLERADEKDKESIRNIITNYLSKKELNIGFLYSYRPHYNYNSEINDVYLIDGQQRLTTLFLTLFYLSLKEDSNKSDFLNLIRFDFKSEKIGFDYRVRTLTHNFLIDIIHQCETLEGLETISEQNWFLSDYKNDVTIKAMLEALKKIGEHFKGESTEYYQFVKKQIRFWHFKTEDTTQGEELYITMNSRGQQLADNETIRARLFENEFIKCNQIEWGSKWEKWQDFFWRNKALGGNADNGFNQFLVWVNIMECFSRKTFKNRELAEKEYKFLVSKNQVLDYVSLFQIEPYFNALERLKGFFEEGNFIEPHFRDNFSIEWLKGDISQIHLIKLLPALMYLKDEKKIEVVNRFIRFFSNVTNDLDIAKNPDSFIIESIQLTKLFLDKNYTDVVDLINFKDQFPRLLANEEVFKLKLYSLQVNLTERSSYEDMFWTAEDHKSCKGKIGHLLQLVNYVGELNYFKYSRSFDYENISSIDCTKFKELFDSYSELIINEDEIWGDLLNTSVYLEENDRLAIVGNWYLNNDFLKLVEERRISRFENVKLVDFLITKEMEFIKTYENIEEMMNEKSAKNQVYLYYILHKRILHKWRWLKWNFGIYDGEDFPKVFSLFKLKYIYQFYNSQWRYNVGYDSSTGIWIQDNLNSKRNYLQELLTWANC